MVAGNSEVTRYNLRFKTILYLCDVEKRPCRNGDPSSQAHI